MAKNKNKKQSAKKNDFAQKYAFWIVFGAILVAAIVIVAIKLITAKPSDPTPEPTQPTPTEQPSTSPMDNSDVADNKDNTVETVVDTTPDKTPAKYEGVNPNTLSKLTGSISFEDIVNNVYTVRVNIDQDIGETGTCVITLSPSTGTPYTKNVRTMANTSTATCNGFDIDVGQLKTGMTYDVAIVISAEDKTMTLRSKVTIPDKPKSEDSSEETKD